MNIPPPLLPRWLRLSAVTVVTALILYGSLVTVRKTTLDEFRLEFTPPPATFVAHATLTGTLAYATDH